MSINEEEKNGNSNYKSKNERKERKKGKWTKVK
jgi:hypothetical protein